MGSSIWTASVLLSQAVLIVAQRHVLASSNIIRSLFAGRQLASEYETLVDVTSQRWLSSDHAEELRGMTEGICLAAEQSPSPYPINMGRFDVSSHLSQLEEHQDSALDILDSARGTHFRNLVEGNSTYTEYATSLAPYAGPLLLAIIAIPIWIFLCCPCVCRCCRRCCCRARKRRKLGTLTSLLYFLIYTAAVVVVTVVCGALSIHYSSKSAEGILRTQCGAFQFLEETLFGSPPETPSNERFIGISNATDTLEFIAQQLDVNRTGGIVDQVDAVLDNTLNFTASRDDLLGKLNTTISALNHTQNNPNADYYHLCAYCRFGREPLQLTAQLLDEGIVQAVSQVRETVNNYLGRDSETLNSISSVLTEQGAMISEMEAMILNGTIDSAFQASQMMDQAEGYRSNAVLGLAAVSVVIALMGLIFLLYMGFCVKRHKASPVPPCTLLNCFMISYIFALLLGGLIFMVTVPTTDACNYATVELVQQGNWEPLVTNWITSNVSDAEFLLNITSTCLTTTGDGNLLSAIGLSDQLNFQEQIDTQMGALSAQREVESFNVTGLSLIVDAAMDYSWLFLLDPDTVLANGEELRLATYPQVLQSGLQDDDVVTTNAAILDMLDAINGTDTVYGLRSVQTLIAPFEMQHLSPASTEFSINQTFDPESALVNQTFNSLVISDGLEEAVKWKNAVWWAHKKQLLRERTFHCPDPLDPGASTACLWSDFSPYVTAGNASDSYLVSLAIDVNTTGVLFKEEVDVAAVALTDDLVAVVQSLLDRVTGLIDGINCKYLQHSMAAVLEGLCGRTLPNLVLLSVVWVLSGLAALIGAVMMLVLYRCLADNRDLKRKNSD